VESYKRLVCQMLLFHVFFKFKIFVVSVNYTGVLEPDPACQIEKDCDQPSLCAVNGRDAGVLNIFLELADSNYWYVPH